MLFRGGVFRLFSHHMVAGRNEQSASILTPKTRKSARLPAAAHCDPGTHSRTATTTHVRLPELLLPLLAPRS